MTARPPSPGRNLLPQHQQHIDESAILPEVAAERGYRSIEVKAELARLGFSDTQRRVPSLLIPVYDVHSEVVLYQTRPDEPRIDKKGKAVKYETPRGSRMALDVPPRARSWLDDPARPLFITEGVRKADSAVSRDLCCISLLGVWNWRGRNEKGGSVALPAWESIALKERLVYIVFDSDVMTKPSVYQALARLKDFLESRGAVVMVIYLPSGVGGTKVGLDDWFAAGHTPDELIGLAVDALRAPPEADEGTELYRASEAGISWVKETRDGPIDVPLTNFDARIVRQRSVDDGAEVRHEFDIHAMVRSRDVTITIPERQFAGMGWTTQYLGADAIVQAGMGIKDHARAAIQFLSGEVPRKTVYAHHGWRAVAGQMLYLHAGGAIGADGPVADVEVKLPVALGSYELPAPPEGPALREAVRASLRLLGVADLSITAPVFSATYRSAITTASFSIFLAGPTQAGKTTLGALGQQHFGPMMDAENLPASWSSTANALEGTAFAAKDALLVVDDFSPSGTAYDVQRLHRDADRLLRAQGNRSGRQRMGPDGQLRPVRPPRGLILSTGEDVPRGQSLRARNLIIETGPNDLDWDLVTQCQEDASAGRYASAMSGFVRWLAGSLEATQRRLEERSNALRTEASIGSGYRRTPSIVASLGAGLEIFLDFAQDCGAITKKESQSLWNACWQALHEAAQQQVEQQRDAEPTRRFRELLTGALASGHAYVEDADEVQPPNPGAWGWTRRNDGWVPRGDRIGWVQGDELYLEPRAAYAASQKMARDSGEVLEFSARTIRKRLSERGLLRSTSERGGQRHLTVRKVLSGKRREVLHVATPFLSAGREEDSPEQAHLAHPYQQGAAAPKEGAIRVGQSFDSSPQDGSSSGPAARTPETNGPDGPVKNNEESSTVRSAPVDDSCGPAPCTTCGGTKFWKSATDGLTCNTCGPPGVKEYVGGWVYSRSSP